VTGDEAREGTRGGSKDRLGATPDATARRAAIFRELLARSDDDSLSLSDLVARHGPEVLDREVPYLVVALRNQTRSRMRQDARQDALRQPAAGLSESIDPARVVLAREELHAVASALSDLEPRDAWAVWWHANGLDDDEIAQLWDEAAFDPPAPSRDYLRKRRERARNTLRAAMAAWQREPPGDR
jgi:hypothetical protein